MPHTNLQSVLSTGPCSAEEWTKVYEKSHEPSFADYVELKLAVRPAARAPRLPHLGGPPRHLHTS